MNEKNSIDDEKDCDGILKKFHPGDRVYVGPLKMEATVIEQLKSFDGPEYWFWGNVLLEYDDGITGTSHNWQLKKLDNPKVENNLIKELMKEANLQPYYEGQEKDIDKFAELIIKECATVCKAVGMKQIKNANESYNQGRQMGAEVCHNQIKKHFGIE